MNATFTSLQEQIDTTGKECWRSTSLPILKLLEHTAIEFESRTLNVLSLDLFVLFTVLT